MDMIGVQDVEQIQLSIGRGHVLYTGGAKGTDELAEEMAKHFGMQVEVIVPPHHPRADYVSPSTVEVLVLANPHLHQAAQKLCKCVPTHFYTLQLLQRNYQIAKKAHTICAFGTLEKDAKQSKGEQGGLCNWLWIKAKKSTCLTFPVKLGTALKTTTTSARILPVW